MEGREEKDEMLRSILGVEGDVNIADLLRELVGEGRVEQINMKKVDQPVVVTVTNGTVVSQTTLTVIQAEEAGTSLRVELSNHTSNDEQLMENDNNKLVSAILERVGEAIEEFFNENSED